jgi:aerobic-type carbon monoxide dehydrogenase small subunit (CoxS/CutS family)
VGEEHGRRHRARRRIPGRGTDRVGDIDAIESICRCGTDHRIRDAIKRAVANM